MKIDRLIGIITTLLQHDRITAPELAKRFEVSRRTIHRDIDDICAAGIPIITYQGGDGGIAIAEGFKLDKNVLTTDELQNILAGLKSIGSVSNTAQIENLIAKLVPGQKAVISVKDSIIIDLASHYRSSLSEKITLIKTAIAENRLVRFQYYSEKGVTERTVEPCFITFKWTAWYLFAYCPERQNFRMFKLNRLWKQQLLDDIFVPRVIPTNGAELGDNFTDENEITVIFDKSMEYRLIEEYGPDCYQELNGGNLEFFGGYTNRDYIITWLLGFGDKARVKYPPDLAKEIQNIAKKIINNYEHDI